MRNTLIAAAAAITLAASGANAQTANTTDNTIDTSYGEPQEREDDDFPWGLLGLLGLAGLIPRKKAPDVHIDNRTNTPR
jgi:hypothetical protein